MLDAEQSAAHSTHCDVKLVDEIVNICAGQVVHLLSWLSLCGFHGSVQTSSRTCSLVCFTMP
jgi:hypothetical protein